MTENSLSIVSIRFAISECEQQTKQASWHAMPLSVNNLMHMHLVDRREEKKKMTVWNPKPCSRWTLFVLYCPKRPRGIHYLTKRTSTTKTNKQKTRVSVMSVCFVHVSMCICLKVSHVSYTSRETNPSIERPHFSPVFSLSPSLASPLHSRCSRGMHNRGQVWERAKGGDQWVRGTKQNHHYPRCCYFCFTVTISLIYFWCPRLTFSLLYRWSAVVSGLC